MTKGLQDKVWTSLPKEFREKVQELYKEYCAERDKEEPGSNRSSLGGRIAMLQELFGSKCLPDACNVASAEPKSAEPEETDHIPAPTKMVDWEQRRYELAKELMKGFVSNPNDNVVGMCIDTLARWSVCGADELIKRLQEKNK